MPDCNAGLLGCILGYIYNKWLLKIILHLAWQSLYTYNHFQQLLKIRVYILP